MILTVKMLRGLLAGLKENAEVKIWLPEGDYYVLSLPSHIKLACDDDDDVGLNIYLRDHEIKQIINAHTKKEAAK